MSNNIVAIVGRPNVGKSTLFNRLTAARTAIEEKVPGVTRDRLYGLSEWSGRHFSIIDTGGITFDENDPLNVKVKHQVELAVSEAQLIIFILDGREGITALDEEIAQMLRRSGKKIVPVVNKIDHPEMEAEKYAFFNLGIGDPMAVSAAHGKGTGDLMERISELLPPDVDDPEADLSDTVKVAVIGRPNVGKSSLINALLGEERVIVSSTPGTTRDAVDTYFSRNDQQYMLIDTAGIRKKSKVKDSVEYYSVLRSLKAVQRADLALLIIDGVDGITEQDQRLAGYVDQTGKGLVLVINKWDLAGKQANARKEFSKTIERSFAFAAYARSVYISSLTGWRLNRLFPFINQAWQEQNKRIQTALLNKLLEDALAVNPHPTVKGRKVSIYYVTQPGVKPPTFVFFANEPDLIHFSYRRYLENRLRESFGFDGTPISIKFNKRFRRGD